MSKLVHLIVGKWSPVLATVPPVLVAFFNYAILGMGNESFHFDGTFWLSFDPNTPCGFFAATLFQSAAVYSLCCFYAPIICIFIGACWSIITFQKDVATDISHLKKRKIADLNERQLTDRFRNFVGFHADVEEFTSEFNGIHEFMIFADFLYGLTTIAISLILFQAVE